MAKLVDSLKCTHNYRARSVQNTSAGSALFRCGDCREPVIIRPSSGCRAHSLETRRLRVVFWQRELLKQAQKGALVEILEHLGSALVAAWQLAKPSFHTAHRHLGDHLLLGSHSSLCHLLTCLTLRSGILLSFVWVRCPACTLDERKSASASLNDTGKNAQTPRL